MWIIKSAEWEAAARREAVTSPQILALETVPKRVTLIPRRSIFEKGRSIFSHFTDTIQPAYRVGRKLKHESKNPGKNLSYAGGIEWRSNQFERRGSMYFVAPTDSSTNPNDLAKEISLEVSEKVEPTVLESDIIDGGPARIIIDSQRIVGPSFAISTRYVGAAGELRFRVGFNTLPEEVEICVFNSIKTAHEVREYMLTNNTTDSVTAVRRVTYGL